MDKLEKVRILLERDNLDAIFISTPANITYLTDFHFLVDTDREAFLVITQKNQYIISSPLYREDLKKVIPYFSFLEFSSAGGKTFWEYIEEILTKEKKQKNSRLGFEATNITVTEYLRLKKLKTKLIPILVDEIRQIKKQEEIERIAKACSIGDTVFSYILSQIKPGMSEKKVGFLLDTCIRKKGVEPAFTTIIAFGKNAAVPHHITSEGMLKKKDIVLFDFGVKYKNYCSDMTRTIFVGTPTFEEKNIYETVKESQQKALDFLSISTLPINGKQVDKTARDYMVSQRYPSFPHSLGHSIGINVHDGFRLSPAQNFNLQTGMVFSVEPGIYLENKLGVRIEDIAALTKNGLEILTKSTKELIIL